MSMKAKMTQLEDILFVKPMTPFVRRFLECYKQEDSKLSFLDKMTTSSVWVTEPCGMSKALTSILEESLNSSFCKIPETKIGVIFTDLSQEVEYHVSQVSELANYIEIKGESHIIASLHAGISLPTDNGDFEPVTEVSISHQSTVGHDTLRLTVIIGLMEYQSKCYDTRSLLFDLQGVDKQMTWKDILTVLADQVKSNKDFKELIAGLVKKTFQEFRS